MKNCTDTSEVTRTRYMYLNNRLPQLNSNSVLVLRTYHRKQHGALQISKANSRQSQSER